MYFFEELRQLQVRRMKIKPRTVIYQHKKPDYLNFWKIWSLKLRFLWGTEPIYFYLGDLVTNAGDLEIHWESWHIWICQINQTAAPLVFTQPWLAVMEHNANVPECFLAKVTCLQIDYLIRDALHEQASTNLKHANWPCPCESVCLSIVWELLLLALLLLC